MSVVRVGSTKKFSDNWQNIFAGGKATGAKAAAKRKSTKTAAKKSVKVKANAKPVAKKATRAKAEKSPTASAIAPPNGKKRKVKTGALPSTAGVGSEEAKKSAAKRKSSTNKRKVAPALEQKELF